MITFLFYLWMESLLWSTQLVAYVCLQTLEIFKYKYNFYYNYCNGLDLAYHMVDSEYTFYTLGKEFEEITME